MALSWPEPRLEFTGHEMPWVIRLRHLHTTIRVANVIIQIPANVVDVKRVAQDALIFFRGPLIVKAAAFFRLDLGCLMYASLAHEPDKLTGRHN